MTRSSWKMATTLAAGLGLFGAGAARAADATEVATLAHVAAAPSVTQSASSLAPTVILAAGQRETNLQKSATFITVSGIDSDRRRRNPR